MYSLSKTHSEQRQLLEYSNDTNMLKAISDYAKAADYGIEDVQFEFDNQDDERGKLCSEKLQ